MKRLSTQRGVAVIEFVLVFTVVFAVFWGLVSYTFPLILLQTMNRSVAEAARVATLVPTGVSNDADYRTAVITVAQTELDRQLNWLPTGWRTPITTPPLVEFRTQDGMRIIAIELRYPNYAQNPIVPSLRLPGIGDIPRLPTHLTARATMTL